MRRPDPLVALTLLGLVLAGVLAMLHPHEDYDPDDPHRQVGRNVTIRLDVLTSEHGDGWSRGLALPTGHAHDGGAGRVTGAVAWVWFRPDVLPQPGDRLDGTARVQAEGTAVELLLSGPDAAHITPGPHAVPVRWDDLLARPHEHAGRLLVLLAQLQDGALWSPDGKHHCPADGTPDDRGRDRWVVRLVPDTTRPGWRCALEAS